MTTFCYGDGMATQPLNTAKVYALTAAGACSVTLTKGEKSITWEALSEGGQTSFIVPAGATASLSDETALLSPLPANFKPALGVGVISAGGERIIRAASVGTTAHAEIKHNTWVQLPATATCCAIAPELNDKAHSMTLMLNPSADLPTGWLTSAAQIVWLYGEPVILSGHTYLIGLTQIEPDKILANLLATF